MSFGGSHHCEMSSCAHFPSRHDVARSDLDLVVPHSSTNPMTDHGVTVQAGDFHGRRAHRGNNVDVCPAQGDAGGMAAAHSDH